MKECVKRAIRTTQKQRRKSVQAKTDADRQKKYQANKRLKKADTAKLIQRLTKELKERDRTYNEQAAENAKRMIDLTAKADRVKRDHSIKFWRKNSSGDIVNIPIEACPVNLKWKEVSLARGSFGKVYITDNEKSVVKLFFKHSPDELSYESSQILPKINNSFFDECRIFDCLKKVEVVCDLIS